MNNLNVFPEEILNYIYEYVRIIHNKNTRNILIRSKIKQLKLRTNEEWIRMIVSFPERYQIIGVKECNTLLKIQWSPQHYFVHKEYRIYKKNSIINRYFIEEIIYKHFNRPDNCVGAYSNSKYESYYKKIRHQHNEMRNKKLKELENQKIRDIENKKWIEKYGYLHYISAFLFGYTIANIINNINK